jgi:hypothetical protein
MKSLLALFILFAASISQMKAKDLPTGFVNATCCWIGAVQKETRMDRRIPCALDTLRASPTR